MLHTHNLSICSSMYITYDSQKPFRIYKNVLIYVKNIIINLRLKKISIDKRSASMCVYVYRTCLLGTVGTVPRTHVSFQGPLR